MSGWLKGTRLWPLALALLATGAIAANTAPAPASLPRDSVYQLPLPLTDQHGVTHDWRTRRGQPQVVAMFYGACPDMCPLTIDGGKAVEHALSPAERRRLQLLYISLDPQRDTPATLAALASKRGLDAQWSLATPRVQDVNGLVWEWTDDFSSLLVSGDARNQGDGNRMKFCGAGSLAMADRENYAVLMRVTMLSSLEARDTTSSLGFRCAKDLR